MNKAKGIFFAVLILLMLSLTVTAFAEEGTVLYVSSTGTGTGETADAPMSPLSAAISKLDKKGGTIVVLDTVSATSLQIPEQSGDFTLRAEGSGSLQLAGNITIARNSNNNVFTFDLPVKVSGSVQRYIYGGHNNVVFGEHFSVTENGKFGLNFYGGSNVTSAVGGTTRPYAVTVNGGTFRTFSAGDRRAAVDSYLASLLAPVTVTVNGGTFGSPEDVFNIQTNNKTYEAFSVSGNAILADGASLTITGGTFYTPIYVQGKIGSLTSGACKGSVAIGKSNTLYANDGDVTITITGGTFNGGEISACQTAADYLQLLRGNFTVTISGNPTFKAGTVLDATQVKAYAGSDAKATLTYPTSASVVPKRFDVVNGKAQTYEEPLRIVFIGDSITEGYAPSAYSVDRLTQSYPAQFLALCEQAGKEVILYNYGLSASGIQNSISHPYFDRPNYPMVLNETDPTYVCFALGTNDGSASGGTNGALEYFRTNFTRFVKEMGDLPSVEKVFVTSAIYRKTSKMQNDIRVSSVIHPLQEETARALAKTEPDKYVFVDLYALTLDAAAKSTLLSSDNLHPAQGGYKIMAQAVYKAIFENKTTAENHKRTDVYVSATGKTLGKGTKEDPTSSWFVAMDKLAYGEEATIHVIGTVSFDGNFFTSLAPSKLTIVGEGTNAILAVSGDSFKLGSDVKIDNLTLRSTGSATHIMACYHNVEITETVKTVGTWSFYAGYNTFSDKSAVASTNSTYDTVETASSDRDCTIVLMGGTYTNLLFGNRRFSGNAPFGVYSGNMTVTFGGNATVSTTGAQYIAMNGMNYLKGSLTVNIDSWPAGYPILDCAPSGTTTKPAVYDAMQNTGVLTINVGQNVQATVKVSGQMHTASSDGKFRAVKTYTDNFGDINGHWGFRYIKTAYEYGLVSGMTEKSFAPDSRFTVSAAVTVAAKIHAIYNGKTIDTATTGAWYLPYVNYCVANGIIQADQFADYEADITRGEMAMVFAAALPDTEYAAVRDGSNPDVTENMACFDAVRKLYRAGVISGDPGSSNYRPDDLLKRPEACVIFTCIVAPEFRAK